jgi:DNA-binding transcriptional MocR family regulator
MERRQMIWTPRMDGKSGPLYVTIAEAIARDLQTGRLRPGELLPAQRELAARLGIDFTTVTRAYGEAKRRGLITARVGHGTYVRSAKITTDGHPNIDLATNIPPMPRGMGKALQAALTKLSARENLDLLLRDHRHAGTEADRVAAARWLFGRLGKAVGPERIVVAGGTQNGLELLFAYLVGPGGVLLTEALTHPSVKPLARMLHIKLHGVRMDSEGLIPEDLAAACKKVRPKALYCAPTIQRPTAAVMSERRRRQIVAIARAHELTVIEDDSYGLLHRNAPQPLTAILGKLGWYIAGLATTIALGLRVAYIVAPDTKAAEKLSTAIRTTTWMAAPLSAALATHWIEDGIANRLLSAIRTEAVFRQKLAADILGVHVAHARSQPEAHYLWLELPAPWSRLTFTDRAKQARVLVGVSDAFAVDDVPPPEAVRVCLHAVDDVNQLKTALRTLVSIIDDGPDARQDIGYLT